MAEQQEPVVDAGRSRIKIRNEKSAEVPTKIRCSSSRTNCLSWKSRFLKLERHHLRVCGRGYCGKCYGRKSRFENRTKHVAPLDSIVATVQIVALCGRNLNISIGLASELPEREAKASEAKHHHRPCCWFRHGCQHSDVL